jgi:hypothetical protein
MGAVMRWAVACVHSVDSVYPGAALHYTAQLNESTLYTKPLKNFPSAYVCENAHRPVIIADSDPGFYRRTVPSPIAWMSRSSNTLSSIGNRSATPGM